MGYLRKLLRNTEKHIRAGGAGVRVVTVAHDNWCAMLNGRGDCNCNPDIKYEKPTP